MSDEKKEVKNDKISEVIPSSLRFPSVLLVTCLEKIKILFNANAKNVMSVDSMGADMGYAPTGGKGSSVLASLKYYGLLVKEGSDRYKVADFVIDYCLGAELNHDVLFTCLNSVPVNKKLFSHFDFNNLPGENVIKSFLIKECRYNLKQATEYIETFKKNKKLYDDNCNEKTELTNNPISVDNPSESSTDNSSNNTQNNSILVSNYKNSAITYPISNNRSVIINLPGDLKDLNEDDLEDVKDILELVLKKVNKQIDLKSKENP